MSHTTHTPGPWVPHGPNVYQGQKRQFGAEPLAKFGYKFGDLESIANARLSAAAPDMLKALIMAESDLSAIMPEFDYDDSGHSGWKTLQEIRDAISKAQGGSYA